MNRRFKVAVICDLDYTLVCLNTADELLKLVDPVRLKILSKLFLPFLLIKPLLGKDVTKLMLAKLILCGMSKTSIKKYSKLLFEEIKQTRKINERLISIINNISSKHRVPLIIVTASLDIIADEFKSLGFSYTIASPTYYKNEIFIDFYDIYKKKHKIIKALLSKELFNKLIIIDDSPEREIRALCSKNNNCMLIKVKICR